ncbi:MAG: hypothetical protein GY810_14505 [Aureispira sp.]|nr:hypothetical protein [Aureispira sp.]
MLIDFFIGFLLMNAMPHFILGIYKGRMLSAFGFSAKANLAYGLLNYSLSIGLFAFQYGLGDLLNHPTYLGALVVMTIYVLTGQFWYNLFQKPYLNNN